MAPGRDESAGVVDPRVDRAEGAERLLDHLVDPLSGGQVVADIGRPGTVAQNIPTSGATHADHAGNPVE
jgi:hypothetical protein